MIKALMARFQQGHRTVGFPKTEPVLPDRLRGLPVLKSSNCPAGCTACGDVCPTEAISHENRLLQLDMGLCLFCADCAGACPTGAVSFSQDYALAARRRDHLILEQKGDRQKGDESNLQERPEGCFAQIESEPVAHELKLARALDQKTRKLFGRSLKLRQVSAGGCNACEADLNVLTTVVFDLGRFGIQFVASPRHADGIVVTGPVTANMRLALQKTYEAIAAPKLVIAVGACAISGGPYVDHPEVHNGADSVLPIDLYVPGCPPHPITILDGLLRLLDRRS